MHEDEFSLLNQAVARIRTGWIVSYIPTLPLTPWVLINKKKFFFRAFISAETVLEKYKIYTRRDIEYIAEKEVVRNKLFQNRRGNEK